MHSLKKCFKGLALVSGVLLATVATPTFADSTTGTTVTITGQAIPGSQVTATVVVTGKHLVDGPGYTVNGGDVQLTLNGALIAQVRASAANSDVYDYGCVDSACGLYKYLSRNTTAAFPVTLPVGIASYQFVGTYTGDTDSHGSTSPVVTVAAVVPVQPAPPRRTSPAVDLLLLD